MRGKDIITASLVGALLIAVACFAGVGVVFLVAGCPSGPPTPSPVTPPEPSPDPPHPEPDPAATACERVCARADELARAGCAGVGGPDCPEACERYERMGGAFARNPECQAKAASCEQYDACRSGN